MVDSLSFIRKSIKGELELFGQIFDETLEGTNSYLSQILSSVKKKGKLMRPMLLLLVAKEYGTVTRSTYLSAVTLELLHTASLIHDDVVDESDERRGSKSINAQYGNQVAVLAGDYLLSTALIKACETNNFAIVSRIAELGRQLSKGEILQLKNASGSDISEEAYFDAIKLKTAALFAMCSELGALSVDAVTKDVEEMRHLGELIGICFQIRDDIFDYYDDSIGKPTGNDLREGKLTLPLVYVLKHFANDEMLSLAHKAKLMKASEHDIAVLVEFAKNNGGIDYAREKMKYYVLQAKEILKSFKNEEVKASLSAYIDFVTERIS